MSSLAATSVRYFLGKFTRKNFKIPSKSECKSSLKQIKPKTLIKITLFESFNKANEI